MFRSLAAGLSLLTCVVFPCSGEATTLNEVKVAIRVVDFMANPPRGRTPLAIFFDGQNQRSVEDARAIMTWLSTEAASTIDFVPTLVDLRQWDQGRVFPVAIVAGAANGYFAYIFDYARHNHTLTLTADLACVRNAMCAVGISGVPRVEVVISRQAAAACGIVFSEAFRMMVTEN